MNSKEDRLERPGIFEIDNGKINLDKDSLTETRILRLLKEKDNLRKVFVEIIKKQPAKAGDIMEDIIIQRSSLYGHLNTLEKMGITQRIKVASILYKKDKKYVEEEISKKFLEWTQTMNQKTKDYYFSRTGYYIITSKGEKFIRESCEIEGIKIKLRDGYKEPEIERKEIKQK